MDELFISDNTCMSCNDQAVFTEFINDKTISLCLDHALQMKGTLNLFLLNKEPIQISRVSRKELKNDK